MFLYFSNNKINELMQNITRIRILFPIDIQEVFDRFILDVQSGSCEIEKYNNVYSIVNNYNNTKIVDSKTQDNVKKKKRKDGEKEDISKQQLVELLNLLRLQFATSYFVCQHPEDSSDNKNAKVIQKETI